MNSDKNLPPGWVEAGIWSEQGQIVSVASGAGVTPAPFTPLLSRVIAPAARVYCERLFLRVIDMAAYDQMFFSLRRNGALIAPWEKINGEQFVEEFGVDVGEVFNGGTLEIVASNISGTPGGLPDPLAIRCIARLRGYLLREQPSLTG